MCSDRKPKHIRLVAVTAFTDASADLNAVGVGTPDHQASQLKNDIGNLLRMLNAGMMITRPTVEQVNQIVVDVVDGGERLLHVMSFLARGKVSRKRRLSVS